jgi:outer membrane protein OmpA-like peptidoglycan-associated protein
MAVRDGRRGIVLPIVVAILGLAAIGVVEDIPVRHSIEHKLTVASTNALAKAGVTVDGVSFTGRDGTVRVDSTADGAQAYAIVSNVNGVRVVRVIVTGAPGGTTPPPVTPTPTPSVSMTAVPSGPATPSPTAAPTDSAPAPSAPATPTPTASPSSATPSATTSPATSPTTTPTPKPTAKPTAPPGGATPAQVQAQLNALGAVTFATGSTTLTSHDKAVIASVARILKANPHVAIRVQGNTDSTGSAAFNLTMSRNRAQTVVNALHALGIATNRMTIVANGESRPLVPNDTPARRSMNRRVDFLATTV